MSKQVGGIFVNGDAARTTQSGLIPAAAEQPNRLEIGPRRSLGVIGRVTDDNDFIKTGERQPLESNFEYVRMGLGLGRILT